jgi:hypothetical protein
VILKIAVLVSEAFCCCVEKASVCKSFCVEASVKKKLYVNKSFCADINRECQMSVLPDLNGERQMSDRMQQRIPDRMSEYTSCQTECQIECALLFVDMDV